MFDYSKKKNRTLVIYYKAEHFSSHACTGARAPLFNKRNQITSQKKEKASELVDEDV